VLCQFKVLLQICKLKSCTTYVILGVFLYNLLYFILVILLGTSELSNNEILLYKLPERVVDDEADILSKDREISIIAAAPSNSSCNSVVSSPMSFKVIFILNVFNSCCH